MSLDTLPTIETPYPSINPTYDISGFLTNGCQPFSPGSVMATVADNHVFWDCRISTGQANDHENRRVFQGLPAELLPPGVITRSAMHGHDAIIIQWHLSGWVFLAEAGRRLTHGSLSFEARSLRRPT